MKDKLILITNKKAVWLKGNTSARWDFLARAPLLLWLRVDVILPGLHVELVRKLPACQLSLFLPAVLSVVLPELLRPGAASISALLLCLAQVSQVAPVTASLVLWGDQTFPSKWSERCCALIMCSYKNPYPSPSSVSIIVKHSMFWNTRLCIILKTGLNSLNKGFYLNQWIVVKRTYVEWVCVSFALNEGNC